MSFVNKYFLYARKSTDVEDKQIRSIDDQLAVLRALAKDENLNITQEFIERQSAKKPGRPVFNEMLALIEKGEAQGIITWKLDRLARNPVDSGRISWLLQQSAIQHIQTHDRSFYPTDNVLITSVEFGMANQFILDLKANTKRGLDAYLDQDIEQEIYRSEKANLLSRKKSLEEKIGNLEQGAIAWVEPLRNWIKDAQILNKIHETTPLSLKKSFIKKIYGLNLFLHAREARGVAKIQWASVAEAHQKISGNELSCITERVTGIEPVTCPWEGHILPLNYTRITPKIFLKFCLKSLAVLLMIFVSPRFPRLLPQLLLPLASYTPDF